MMQKPIVQPWYPHMLAEDIEVWSEFLKDPPFEILGVWYDLRVGKPVTVAPGGGELDLKIAAGMTKKRIDAVVRTRGGYLVIEIKPFGSYLALGQALTYARLFVVEFDDVKSATPGVVCSAVDPDLVDDYERLGVVLIEV